MRPEKPDLERPNASAQPVGAAREFVVRRSFRANPQALFDAFTRSEVMSQWMGPNGFSCPVCELDVRPGGKYRLVMRGPDGVDFPLRGEYREISPGEKLVYSEDISEHPPVFFDMLRKNGLERNELHPSLVTVTFDDATGGGTKLTVRTLFETPKEREAMVKTGMQKGWNESLDRLDAVLTRH